MTSATEKIIRTLIQKVARMFDVEPHHITCDRRNANFVRPRHLVMHALFKSGFSQADIATAFQKDHVTVSHAVRSIEHHMTKRAIVRRQAKSIANILDAICAKQFDRPTGVASTIELESIDARIARLENRVAELERK